MQKFRKKLKNTPKDASQVLCSVNSQLNKEETLSVESGLKNDKLFLNNPDGNQSESNRRQNMSVSVYVLNKRGEPLMPCSPRKAKVLLKQGKAKVVKRSPFTIQLSSATGETKQEIVLGVDTGYKNIGISAISEKKELLSANVELRTNVSDLLKEKAMYRRNRRNKLWYRKPRWNNRANARKEGRLMPSVLHKVNTHISVIEKIKRILPISKVVLETGLFDMQKMENDKIKSYQYQKGEMFGFENIKSYVLSRDSHQCFFKCKDAHKLEVHHIKFRSQGGTDNPNNLITLCSVCHKKVHAGKLELNVKKHKELKSATIMNVIRKRLLEFYLDAVETFGYETKVKRREIKLEKSHINDAFVIAGGANQKRIKSFEITQKRKNNRCLQLNRKGFKPSIRKKKYAIQPKDVIIIENQKYIVKGIFNKGTYVRVFDSMQNILNFRVDRIEKHFYQGSLVWN